MQESPLPREGRAAEPGNWALHHVWVALMCVYGMNFPGMWICFQILLQTTHLGTLTHAISTQRAPSWDTPQAFVCKCTKLNLINPLPALPACTQQPYRPLVQLNLSVSEVRHLLEGVDGDEHRPDVGLGSKSRSRHPLPCPPVLPITSEHPCLLVRQHQE